MHLFVDVIITNQHVQCFLEGGEEEGEQEEG